VTDPQLTKFSTARRKGDEYELHLLAQKPLSLVARQGLQRPRQGCRLGGEGTGLDVADRATPTEAGTEEVIRIWVREWAKEGVATDWKKLLPPKSSRAFLPRRWWWSAPSRGSQTQRMSKDYERLVTTS
jgi:hypothetical protein